MANPNGVNYSKEFWDNIKDEIIELYTSLTMSTYQLANKYGCGSNAITHHLKQWGVYNPSFGKRRYNRYVERDDYIVGYTRNDNYEFYIDKQYYDFIRQYCWCKHPDGYLRTRVGEDEYGHTTYKLMHVMIMEYDGVFCSDGEEIDHQNGMPNDNRRNNLRVSTHFENMRNRKIMINNTSGHPGVHYSKNEDRWKAYITVDGKRIHIGTFKNKEDAINARDKYEDQYYKEYKRQDKDQHNGTR